MPIFDQDTHLFIVHRTIGNSPQVQQLGEMSVETAIFLEAKLLEKELNAANVDTEGTIDQNSMAMLIGVTNFLNNPKLRESITRATNAGNRTYKPALCSEYGNLSPIGVERAKVARQVISEINNTSVDGTTDIAYNPDRWTRTDEIIINGTITKRSLRFLDKMTDALDAVEADHAAAKMREMTRALAQPAIADYVIANANSTENENKNEQIGGSMAISHQTTQNDANPSDRSNDTNQPDGQKPLGGDDPDFSGIIDIADIKRSSELNVSLVRPTLFPMPNAPGGYQAFVPTAPFGQRARTDTNYLIKYGLVDLKAYITGRQGRPKHVIRTSIQGRKVLTDLRNLGLL